MQLIFKCYIIYFFFFYQLSNYMSCSYVCASLECFKFMLLDFFTGLFPTFQMPYCTPLHVFDSFTLLIQILHTKHTKNTYDAF